MAKKQQTKEICKHRLFAPFAAVRFLATAAVLIEFSERTAEGLRPLEAVAVISAMLLCTIVRFR